MKSAGVRSEQKGDKLLFYLSGEIDHHSAKYLRERIDAEMYFFRPKTAVLVLTDVGFMDSAGLGLILGRYTKAQDLGSALVVKDPSPEIERILALAGADKFITVVKTKKEVTV